jgi:NADH:ubiquinone oxidoreductase subunit E
MTTDPKKFREIARACSALSRTAANAEERHKFATFAQTYSAMAESGRHVMISTATPCYYFGRDALPCRSSDKEKPRRNGKHRGSKMETTASGSDLTNESF